MAEAIQQSAANPKKPSKHAQQLQKQYAKQQKRKTPKDTLPSPHLDIPIDHYTSFVTHLKSSKRVLALLGAGLSAASGVPTFRGPGGFWREHDCTTLGTPEAFEKDPSLVWQFYNYRRHMALRANPNKAHIALAKMAVKHPDFLAINQNTDGLCQRAQHPPSSLLSIHGSLFNIKCSNSQCTYTETGNFTDPIVPSLAIPSDWPISDARFPLSPVPVSSLPHCPQCDSLLRPDIVWFGEQIAQAARARIHEWLDAAKVDLMMVIGTSATVWPAAIYIHAARLAGARIAVFNTEEVDEEMVDPSQKLREQDWFFKGDAAAVVPDVLKEVVGVVGDTK
ncbi:MAG: hypothetical protein Q9168_005109 [Polycauliona sp. 1 TL-2023]